MSQEINLFDAKFRSKRYSPASAGAFLQYFSASIVLVGAAAAYVQYPLQEMQVQLQAAEKATQDAATRRDKLVAASSRNNPDARLDADIAALDARLQARQQVLSTLQSGAVGNTEGFSGFMRAFSQQVVNGLWLTAFDIGMAGGALAIQGRTLSADLVAGYLKQLNREKVLQGRQFAALRISQPPPDAAAYSATAPAGKAPAGARSPLVATPRYLEFTISTLEMAADPKEADRPAPREAQLLGALDAVKTNTAPGDAR
jgi:Tfp pilus assembly protein PilN